MSAIISQQLYPLAAFLHAVPGIGVRTVISLLEQAKKIRTPIPDIRVPQLVAKSQITSLEKITDSIRNLQKEYTIDSYWESLKDRQIRFVVRGSAEYPQRLERLEHPPPILYVQGCWPLKEIPSLAVVGARRCTPYGVRATRVLVSQCCSSGINRIVSGLMYGIDATAHQVALNENTQTVAVLGYGLGQWFPRQSEQLAQEILQHHGTLITEYPPNMPPNKGTFLERNRIVAALADAVLVPEAGARSGTQRTVAVAAELGIPVGAVPGPFDNPMSEGTKACINQGAVLVTSATDLLVELGLDRMVHDYKLKANEHPVVQQLQFGPQTTDQLCLTLQQSVVQLSFELSSLELAGRIVRRGAQWYCK